MARKGLGPYGLGAPKTVAKQQKGNVAGPLTEDQTPKRTRIKGPYIDAANEEVQQRHTAFEEAKKKGPQIITTTDSDGRDVQHVEFNNQRYTPGDQKRRKQRNDAINRGVYDNWENNQFYNNKHSYDYENNILDVTDSQTGKKKIKQTFHPNHRALRTPSGGVNRALTTNSQENNRTRAEYDQRQGNTRSDAHIAAQRLQAEHKMDSVSDAHRAQTSAIIEKFLNKNFPPTPNKLSSAFKMSGYPNDAIGKKYKK